ncbi:MAG: PorP/SprF family type IX secretion system membrane protein [Chitinophagales bacterium]
MQKVCLQYNLVGFLLFLPLFMLAQNVEFSQFYAAPLHLNPALAGISHGPRIGLNYRNQWPELGNGPSGGFVTYGLSYDQHIEKLQGGLGIMLISDRIANNNIVQNSVQAAYSYQIRVSNKFGIKIGLGGSYTHRYIDFNQLLFYDQIDPVNGFYQSIGMPNPTSQTPPDNPNTHTFNANAGVVFFTPKHFFGVAVNDLVPEKDFYGDNTNKMRFAFHGGTIVTFGKHHYNKKGWLSPQVLFANRNNFNQISVGSMIGWDFIYTGIWVRHTFKNFDAVISGVGFKKGVLRFGYSFDINLSPLKGTAGSHEFSIVFNLTKEENSLNPSYTQGYTPCPFYLDF